MYYNHEKQIKTSCAADHLALQMRFWARTFSAIRPQPASAALTCRSSPCSPSPPAWVGRRLLLSARVWRKREVEAGRGGGGGGVGRRKKGGIEGVGERESENDKKQAWRPHNKKPESELGSGPSCDPRGWGAQFWNGLLRLQLRYHS